jgi:hypothetical protein
LALVVNTSRMAAASRLGSRSSRSAAMPLTWAAATDVPVVTWKPPLGAGSRISTPGAATAT